MCGVLGFIKLDVEFNQANQSLLNGISVLQHRGPNSSNQFIDQNVGLGHVRLSILDLSSAGSQPFKTPSGRFIISYNGEVYNHKEIAEELNIQDKCSGTDTEIIVRAFELIGVKLFSKLNGMFVFSIYDRENKKMWVVRDRVGIKSLFYKSTENSFWFSSEVKAIFAMEGELLPRYLEQDAVHEWSYFGSSLGENNLFLGIKRLLPGHYLEIDTNTCEIRDHVYWYPNDYIKQSFSIKKNNDACLIAKTKELLENAVKRQLMSDVPVGVFLSGGVDSSAITAFASKHYHSQISTYSVVFDYETKNELLFADLIARKFNTAHHEIRICGVNVADTVEKMVYHHDSPFSDAANIPLYLLCSEIKDESKVILQGDGGDELFGGYKRYHTLMHLNKWKVIAKLVRKINVLAPKTANYYTRNRYINALLAEDDATMMALLLTVEDREYSPLNIFSESYKDKFSKSDPFARYRIVHEQFKHIPIVNRMLYVDQSIILPDIFLEKVDKSTMAASVEVRVPFLDHELLEFCMTLTVEERFTNGALKGLLKKSLENIIPNSILYRKKQGFGVPYGFWIKTSLSSLLQDHLSTFNQNNNNVLNMKYIKQVIAAHSNGQRDHGFLLWKLLQLVIWSNQNKIIFNHA